MSDVFVFVFGSYWSQNYRLDPKKTKNLYITKWRSQFLVPRGSQISYDRGDWVFVGGEHIVYISDLDYQLRNSEPIGDEFRISDFHNGTAMSFYAGGYPQIKFEHFVKDSVVTSTNPNQKLFALSDPFVLPTVDPEYISFAEERLELGYDYGAVGGPSFATDIISTTDEREQRNAKLSLPLGRWQLGDRALAESEVNQLVEVSYLKQFHGLRRGSYQGFRYKDWSDYLAEGQDIAVGDGVKTGFQLRKAYKAGNAVTYRPIQKPVPGTVALYVDGMRVPDISEDPDNGWHIDVETGVVTGNLPLGSKLTASFEFDVPVWFESDSIDFRLEYFDPNTNDTMYRLGSVFVVEGRLPFAIPWSIEASGEINEELDLGIVYDTTETYQISNYKLPLQSGYSRRENVREDSLIQFNLSTSNYNRFELDKLLGYFWNAKGSLAEFEFKNQNKSYIVRFNQDRIDVRFEASNDSDALFSLQGLKIQVKEEIIFKLPRLPEFFTNIFQFEISNFAVTNEAQTIEQNSFTNYGGGSSSFSITNSTSQPTNSSEGFGGTFGSVVATYNSLENAYGYRVQSFNFIDNQPVVALYGLNQPTVSISSRINYPYVALPANKSEGSFAFDVVDPFSEDPNVASNSVSYPKAFPDPVTKLLNVNDILIVGENGRDNFFWAYSVQKTDSGFSINTYTGNNYIGGQKRTAPGYLGDGQYIKYHSSSTLYFEGKSNVVDGFDLSGVDVVFHNTFLSVLGDNRTVRPYFVMPTRVLTTVRDGSNLITTLKPYTSAFYYYEGNSLYKADSNDERTVLCTWERAQYVNIAVDASNSYHYAIYKVDSNNSVFPHELNASDNSIETYYLCTRVNPNGGEIEFLGSWAEGSLINTFGSSELDKIFASEFHGLVTKGMLCTTYGYLVDLINGGIINLKKNPNFFPDTILEICADKNGFGFYNRSTNQIGYLAVNRA